MSVMSVVPILSVRKLCSRLDAMINDDNPRNADLSLCYSCTRRETRVSLRGLNICSLCYDRPYKLPIPFDEVFVKEYPTLLAAAQKRAMSKLVMAVLSNKSQTTIYDGICDCCMLFAKHYNMVSGDVFCDKCVIDAVNRGKVIVTALLVLGEITFTSIPDVNKLIRFTSAYIMI